MQLDILRAKWRQFSRQQRRLVQAILVALSVAGAFSLLLWAGLFNTVQAQMADYLYDTKGDPGDDIVIVAIDERSVQALGEWPFPLDPYVRLFERLGGADVVGFDVLLTDPGPEGNLDTPALLEATRRAGNVVVPIAALEMFPPESEGKLYSVGQAIPTFAALREAAAGVGSVNHVLDVDGTLRRVPLLVEDETGKVWEAFGLQILKLQLGLGDARSVWQDNRVLIGDDTGIAFDVPTDMTGMMLVNFVGRPNTFPAYSLIDVIEDRVDAGVFEDKTVLVGMMNTLAEMDLHRTPVSAGRMSGVEFTANAIHTLHNHRALVPQGRMATAITIFGLALASAVAISQSGAVLGAVFTAALALGYFVLTSMQFNAGMLPNVLFPYVTIFINYAALTAAHFASEQLERNRVTDVFGRFVSPEVRNAIVAMAMADPELIQPGGREMHISVLFADIRGFTTISENLEPPEVVAILNLYLDSMEEEVFKHGGTLDKYTGDGMMVLFGAPIEQPDHAERAVQAALGMQRAAAEVSRQRGDVKWEVAYGIGITTGPAVVGHIGSKRRLDYTAIGDTVNLAARLEGQAPPGTILIDRATVKELKGIIVEKLEPVMVRGKAKPVPVYEPVGRRRDSAPVDAEPTQ